MLRLLISCRALYKNRWPDFVKPSVTWTQLLYQTTQERRDRFQKKQEHFTEESPQPALVLKSKKSGIETETAAKI